MPAEVCDAIALKKAISQVNPPVRRAQCATAEREEGVAGGGKVAPSRSAAPYGSIEGLIERATGPSQMERSCSSAASSSNAIAVESCYGGRRVM